MNFMNNIFSFDKFQIEGTNLIIGTVGLKKKSDFITGRKLFVKFFVHHDQEEELFFNFPQYLPISTLQLSLLARFLFHLFPLVSWRGDLYPWLGL